MLGEKAWRIRSLRVVLAVVAVATCVTLVIISYCINWTKIPDLVKMTGHSLGFRTHTTLKSTHIHLSSNQSQEPLSSNRSQETLSSNRSQEPLFSNRSQEPLSSNRSQEPLSSNRSQEPLSSNRSQEPLSSNQSQEPLSSNQSRYPISSNKSQRFAFSKKCRPHHHIGFIKIHKAGSSTVSNILFRFGMANNLTFILPRNGVFISLMQTTSWSNILPPPQGKGYHVLCSHAVYVKPELTRLLPADTFYSAIIRHPLSHLRSVIYYFYKTHIPGPRKVKKFLKNPFYFSNLLFNNLRSFTNNSMSYELGLSPEYFYDKNHILAFLDRLHSEFGLVLIMERMDESLVLLRRYLCWELRDILYVKRNANILKPEAEDITANLKQKHAQIDMADYMLYHYFSTILETRIRSEGVEFLEEVNVFKSALNKLRELCFGLAWPRMSHLYVAESKWNRGFNVSLEECKLYLFDGNEILNYVKHYQYPDQF